MQPFDDGVTVGPSLYVVARKDDNMPFSEDATTFSSQASANEYLRQQVADDPNLAKELHTIPEVEMQRAA